MMDPITELAAQALAQGRVVGTSIDRVVVPALPHTRRGMAAGAAARIAGGRIFDEDFLRLLHALSDALTDIVDANTIMDWRGHEHDPSCGYAVPIRDGQTEALAAALGETRALWTAIAATLDAARAYRAANELAGA